LISKVFLNLIGILSLFDDKNRGFPEVFHAIAGTLHGNGLQINLSH